MSQLLDWEKDSYDEVQYLIDHGWRLNDPNYSEGWSLKEGSNTYWCQRTYDALLHQKGLEGVRAFKTDMVNSPPHYNQFGIEVVDILETYFPNNPHLWNAGKYLLRSGYKGHEIEDLKKLVWYVERYIKFKESRENTIPAVLGIQGNQARDSGEVGS